MADRYALALAEVAELASELAEARRDLGLQPDDAARPEAIAARLRTEAALRETRPAEAPTTAAPPTEEDDGGAAVERAERAATAKRRRKRSLVPPGSAAADAERLLSTHRLGKTGQHFVCAASLGPRGGPAAEAAREADRAKRRLRAEEAWSAVELRRTRKRDGDNPGPASHAVTYEAVKKRHASATLGPATKNARAVSQARPRAVPAAPDGAAPDGSACEKCYATCWYGCDCDCHEQHGGDDDDDESQGDPQEYDLQVEAEVEAEVVSPGRRGDNRKPPPMRQPGPPPRKTKLAPPLWLCALLQRAAVDEDFRVEFVELEKGLRRAQDARPDDAKHGLGLKFLAAVRATHETVEGWFKSGDDDLRERLTKANLTEEDLNALFGGSVTWAKIETVLGTVLAPWHVSTRLKRALDARKLRLADVFRRAQDQDGLVSANALAAAIAPVALGRLAAEFGRRELEVSRAAADGGDCCAATCWYGCACPCHGGARAAGGADDDDDDVSMADDTDETQRTFLELGSHVQVRAAGSAEAYFGGTVACTYDDGSFDVEYDDGLYESRVPQQRLQGSQHEATTEPRAVRRHTFAARKPWPAPKKPMDAAVVTRTDKGFVAWRTEPAPKGRAEVRAEPTDKGAADGPVELRASAIAAAARAVLPRRDRGVYAWGTSDRGLAPAAKAPLVDDGGDTPQSLRGALRPHVAGFAFNAPEYGPLTASFASDVDIPDDFLLTGLVKRKPDGKLGPGAYDARWDVAKPRALGHAMVAESTAQLRPQAQLALARRRGVDGAPGEYDVNDDYNSRFARKPTATIAAERAHEARRRRADVEADVEALARLARKKLRAAARRDRALREKEREADAKFKAWRAKKLGGDFDQLFASDSSDGFDEAALASSDDGGTPLSLTRATRRSRRHTTINPERAQLPAALANRRAHEETLEAQRGPAAYDVRRSMAVTEKGVVTAATFGAEREARERREQDSKAQTKLAFKRAAEHAAEEARSKLLGPQLLFNWVSPADGDGEANEYSRFARSSKAVFRYVPKAATPERVRDARLLAEAARAARDAAPSPKYVDADDDVLDIGKGPGRDVTEVLRKGLVRVSHFGSPGKKPLRAPKSADYDADAARAFLLPDERGAAAAFAATQRDERFGPFGERPEAYRDGDDAGDVLLLDPKVSVGESRRGFTFSRAADSPRGSDDEAEGNVLDLSLDQHTLAKRTARGHRYMRFSKGDERFEAEAADEPEDELWLSPARARTFLERSQTGAAFGQALRFSDDAETPGPALILSPKYDATQRRLPGGVPFARQSERWDRDEELLLNSLDDAEARRMYTAASMKDEAGIDAVQAAKGGIGRRSNVRLDLDFSRGTERFRVARDSPSGDVLQLSPKAAKSQRALLDWHRQSERWESGDDAERERGGDVLNLDPRAIESDLRQSVLDIGAGPERFASDSPRSRDGDRLELRVDARATQKRLKSFNMSKQLERDDEILDDDRDGALMLSPKGHLTLPRNDRSVNFQEAERFESDTPRSRDGDRLELRVDKSATQRRLRSLDMSGQLERQASPLDEDRDGALRLSPDDGATRRHGMSVKFAADDFVATVDKPKEPLKPSKAEKQRLFEAFDASAAETRETAKRNKETLKASNATKKRNKAETRRRRERSKEPARLAAVTEALGRTALADAA